MEEESGRETIKVCDCVIGLVVVISAEGIRREDLIKWEGSE